MEVDGMQLSKKIAGLIGPSHNQGFQGFFTPKLTTF